VSIQADDTQPHTNGHKLVAGTFRVTSFVPPRGVLELDGGVSTESFDGLRVAARPFDVRSEAKRVVGAILIAAPLAPVLAAILSVLSMADWLAPKVNLEGGASLWQAALVNLGIAWLSMSVIIVVLGLSTAKGALPGTCGELDQWLFEIGAWLKYLGSPTFPLPHTIYAYSALRELGKLYERIQSDLAENGARWFVGTGYVNVWRLVHQAQETLIRLISDEALPAAARIELLRFGASDIGGRDEAIAQLQAALTLLDSADGKPPAGAATTPTSPNNALQARHIIEVMRAKADQYRDKARIGLARARSDVTRTLTMTTTLSYALFWTVIEARYGFEFAQQTTLTGQQQAVVNVLEMGTGAITLFLWGALVGLFGQLWLKWNANPDAGEDDFGLAISRVIAEPVLAGVAGMCGVVVLTFGGPLLNSGLGGLTNGTVAAAANLQNAFLPGTSPASLLFAALFALSPNLLISRLQQAGSTLQQNLSNSSAGDGGGTSNKSTR
jgi:hypothetical protein